MCVACESLSVLGCSGGSGHGRETLNVRLKMIVLQITGVMLLIIAVISPLGCSILKVKRLMQDRRSYLAWMGVGLSICLCVSYLNIWGAVFCYPSWASVFHDSFDWVWLRITIFSLAFILCVIEMKQGSRWIAVTANCLLLFATIDVYSSLTCGYYVGP